MNDLVAYRAIAARCRHELMGYVDGVEPGARDIERRLSDYEANLAALHRRNQALMNRGDESVTVAVDNRCPSCVIAGDQVKRARQEVAESARRATYAEELVVVALRMLKRAGKLKPTTDDERAAVELCSYLIDVPAAQRRLLHPMTDDYVTADVAVGQERLFDTTSQESVNTEEDRRAA